MIKDPDKKNPAYAFVRKQVGSLVAIFAKRGVVPLSNQGLRENLSLSPQQET